MVIETKIRFEAGGVTITQTSGPELASQQLVPFEGKTVSLQAAGKAEEEGDLGDSYQAHGAANAAGINVAAVRAAGSPVTGGAGDPGRPTTGGAGDPGRPATGGGGALSGGLTIVFGSLIMDCGTGGHVAAKTDSTGNVKRD